MKLKNRAVLSFRKLKCINQISAPKPYGSSEMENKLKDYYEKQNHFKAFQGRGGRIDGKKKGTKGKSKS